MTSRLIQLIRWGARQPPGAVARWALRQAAAEFDHRRWPAREERLTEARLLAVLGAESLDSLWARLAEAPFPATTGPVDPDAYEARCPGDADRILAAARDAAERRVDLLGSGPVELGTPIDWRTDFKSGRSWPMKPARRLDVLDLGRGSDVKVPWELARLQWLIPLGQAYRLTGDEAHAEAARAVVAEWIRANPAGQGVNWACAMEAALRGIALVWLFRAFHASAAWADPAFRFAFLKSVYLHGEFVSRNLEWSDVSGNHLLADAAGKVVIGLFLDLGAAPAPRRWADDGWRILTDELPGQVFADGVDFEASTAYQRLVLEILLLPALHRRARGLEVPVAYAARLREMANFVAHYSREDGTSPLWGDADDGRVLPFGGQAVTDHRYLVHVVGAAFADTGLLAMASGPRAEAFWLLGADAAAAMPETAVLPGSRAFPEGGVYVMREGRDQVFIDSGPVGMAGRGGHGHNDCLSVDAVLAGAPLLTDCGAYVYSADREWRNSFRSTAFHNTPVVDGREINRFAGPDLLWTLMDDAKPHVRLWRTGDAADVLVASHSGYRRLSPPVTPVRAIMLEKRRHRLFVADRFEGTGRHNVRVPYHFAPGVEIADDGPGRWRVAAGGNDFVLAADADGWEAHQGEGWVSPSYGVKRAAPVLNFIRSGELKPLTIALIPAAEAPGDLLRWLRDAVAGLWKPGKDPGRHRAGRGRATPCR